MGFVDNVNVLTSNIANVNIVSASINNVNRYAATYYPPTTTDPTTRVDGTAMLKGDLFFNTTLNEMRVYTGAVWKSAGSIVNGTSKRQSFTATAGQTTFTISGGYSANFADVYLNGSKLVNGTDVDVTSGTDVVLATGATAGDIVDVVAYGDFKVANTVDLNSSQTISGIKTFTSSPAIPDATASNEPLSKGQLLAAIKAIDGSGSGLDADMLDGLDSTQFVRSDVSGTNITGTFNMKADNQFKFRLFNTKNRPSSEIHFNSYINYGSDYGYIRYDDDNNRYNRWGDSGENSALVLGAQNDGQDASSDVVALESPAGIFLNAPDVYIGDKTGGKVWCSSNDGSGSGLDADLVRGLPADFTSSKAANGYQKLPSGLIIQWGKMPSGSNESAVNFPITFPNAIVSFVGTSMDSGNSFPVQVKELTTTYYNIDSQVGGTPKEDTYWIAIGY